MSDSRKISVIGLGYVGLPVAVAFGKQHEVIGFDINPKRIEELQQGIDRTLEVSPQDLAEATIRFTCQAADLQAADFHIIAVPTPINSAKQPDLTPLLRASETLGAQLKRGDIVVYESTVYPGATEEDCMPVLERCSGLQAGKDFTLGYSPERINPGDKEHTFTKICKVVSGQDAQTLAIVADVYASVVTAGVHKAASIKVAEAAKVIENTQRDLNIALMNELAVIFKRMNIVTLEVRKAAGTKWNFRPFKPGLVGGHCIGVDPYYLTHKSQQLGYNPEVILAGRRINDGMGEFIVEQLVRQMILHDRRVKGARIGILGLTFKEDCPDLRNSRVIDVINTVKQYGAQPFVHDPMADTAEAEHEYGVQLCTWESLSDLDAVILAVGHAQYRSLTAHSLLQIARDDALIADIKGIVDRDSFNNSRLILWRL